MIGVSHIFKKRPSAKYLANRTLSFKAEGEIDHIGPNDVVSIEVFTPGGKTYINVTGKDFLKNISTRYSKRGVKVKIFKF